MSVHPRSRLVNPLLGTYFGIFVSSLVAIVLLIVIFEQLGVAEETLRLAMMLGSVALYAIIGAGAYTAAPSEFFLSGRRVPAFFNGLVLATAALGGTGLVAGSGALFLAGFDALCVPLGILAGLVLMVILIAPFLRKFGAPSIPSYLGRRFDSGTVRVVAASICVAPLVLLFIAELKIAVWAIELLTDFSPSVAVMVVSVALIATLGAGGIRSLSWSGSAQALTMLLTLLVPVAIVSVLVTNLPLGQMSHGPVLRGLMRTEMLQGVPTPVAGPFSFYLPGPDLQPIASRYATAFGNVGPIAFVLAILSIMAGIAGSPALLTRAVTTPSVYETRKSIGWSVFLIGVIIMTVSASCVFLRDILMSTLVGSSPSKLPVGIKSLIDQGLAAIDGRSPQLSATSFLFKRDGALLALPVMMGFPRLLAHLVTAGAIAAALAAAATALMSLATILAEDVINAPESELASDSSRVGIARLAIAGAAIPAAWLAVAIKGDPLDLLLWSLALSGSSIFPVLVLSIWWKRINPWGAVAGMTSGFAVALLILLIGALNNAGFGGALAPALAIPIATFAAVITSRVTTAPDRQLLELVRELRVPGGETIYDRSVRQARQQARRLG